VKNPLSLLVPEQPPGPRYGALARFESTKSLFSACERVRDAGYTRWDAHTPFPVHGLDRAMGLRRSKLPFLVLATGLGGAGGGMLLQWWIHTQAYALNFSGKPTFSWPAFVPVTFELGVLGAAAGAVFGMFAINKLPTYHHPLFSSAAFERATDDAMFISIESWDPKFDAERTPAFLREIGAVDVELIAAT
jgi:hypothetical protein